MPPLPRCGRLPLPLRRILPSSSQIQPPPFPSTRRSSGGGRNLTALLLLSARPPRRAQLTAAAKTGSGGRRGLGFCSRALDTEETPTSAAVADGSSPYLSARIRCRKQDADALSDALLCFGASSVTMDETGDYGDLDEICITSIFADGEDVGSCVSNAASSIGLSYIPSYETSVGKQCDWVAHVQEMFHSTKVIDGLWIVPKWRNPPDLQATNIIINPGLAFGTGEHPTTKLCLLLLRRIVKGGEHVLDYGTGSGVLGIAALKMGAAFSTGIDIEPQAVTSARENILLNGLDPSKMPVYLVSTQAQPLYSPGSMNILEGQPRSILELEASRGTYDIVAANILLNPLCELVEDIVSFVKPGGLVGVSGILSEQVPKLEEVYFSYLDNVMVHEMDGWACLVGTKRGV